MMRANEALGRAINKLQESLTAELSVSPADTADAADTTNQPTKGPLEIRGVDWGGTSWSAAQVRTSDGEVLAVFRGPDCEANAALFIRAQHMDELVEALEGMLSWAEKRPDKHPFDTWERARDVLAKIKGER